MNYQLIIEEIKKALTQQLTLLNEGSTPEEMQEIFENVALLREIFCHVERCRDYLPHCRLTATSGHCQGGRADDK